MRMASSFPKSLNTSTDCEQIASGFKADRGPFEIRIFAAGEICLHCRCSTPFRRHVECGQTASYYYIGKNPALAFDTALPFG